MRKHRPYGYREGLDEPLPPEARKAWEEWLASQDIRDLVRTLERQSWQAWSQAGYTGERYKLQPDMRDDIKRRLALLIHRQGGRYNDHGAIVCSDGRRIWTELP